MRFIPILLLLAGCSGLTTRSELAQKKLEQCIEDQRELYDDLCAEIASGYENMTPIDSHRDGVSCATDSALQCVDDFFNP